jgi:hypothetical protein
LIFVNLHEAVPWSKDNAFVISARGGKGHNEAVSSRTGGGSANGWCRKEERDWEKRPLGVETLEASGAA